MRTRLELGSSGSIDLMDNVPYSLNYSIADIREPDKRNSDYSKTITIPGSKQNNALFAHIFEINIACNFNPNLKTPCILYVDEIQQMKGYLQLLKINKTDDNKIEYEVCIKGNVGNVFNVWSEQYLTALDLSAYDHTLNKTVQKASQSAPVGVGYVYPMIDYGVTNGLTFDVENLYPAIYVKQYIDSLFTLAGYSYTSAFFNTDFFKRLIIPHCSTNLLLSATQITARYFKAKVNADTVAITKVVASDHLLATSGVIVALNADVSDVSNQFNTSTYSFTPALKGTYEFTSSIIFNFGFSGLSPSPQTSSAVDVGFFICIVDANNNTISVIGSWVQNVPAQSIANAGTTATYTSAFTSPSVVLTPTQRVVLKMQISPQSFAPCTLTFNILANSTFENKIINTGLFDGDSISLNSCIPEKIKIKDFFTSIIKMFNLYIETDKTITNMLLIEPRNDFYSAGVTKDWTDKLSIDRVLDITPMGDLIGSRYDFQYKEDKDFYNSKYQNSYLEPYGTYHKDVATDFVRDTKKVDVIFSATPLAQIGTTDRIISQIVSTASDGSISDVKNSNIRILYYGGLTNTANSWQYTGTLSGTTTETQYAYAGHVDVPLLPTFDLNFGVPQTVYYQTPYYTDNNLFNNYYKKFIDEITDKDSKVITAWFYLTPLDIFILDFRNQFFVDGSLLRLNKIYDYNPLSNDLTRCEFIRIKQANPFVATSANLSGFRGSYPDGNKYPGIHWLTPYIDASLKNFVGAGNNVDSSTRSSIVTGVGNYIGEGCTNISMLSSSGCTVMPGLSNVIMIGSVGTIASQSNSTYVNGVLISNGGSEVGIIAHAGGGQASAYQTTKKTNRIDTVATTADSIMTLNATLDAEQIFTNRGANSMNVYPKPGEQFKKGTTLLGANVPYAVASRNTLHIYCYETGVWTD